MEYRRLGKSGLQVSAISFGSWLTFAKQIGDDVAETCMKLAYDSGINFFDNAEIYSNGQSEKVMGNILSKMKWDRSTYLVSSKVYWGGKLPNQVGLSRKHIMEACDASLKRLQVDYLDLYFCHRPDSHTPVEETAWAMNHLIQQGKVLYWGTSEWNAQQITEAHMVCRQNHLIPPTMEQPQYNMFHREKVESEFNPLFRNFGMGTTIWSPLASGLLTGKYNKGLPKDSTRASIKGLEWLRARLVGEEVKDKIEQVKALAKVAKKLNTSLPCLALAWCLKNQNVSTVITGASRPEQLQENMKSLDVVPLITEEIVANIEKILNNKPSPSEF